MSNLESLFSNIASDFQAWLQASLEAYGLFLLAGAALIIGISLLGSVYQAKAKEDRPDRNHDHWGTV